MKLTTPIILTSESNQIDYTSKVLLLGSCFTENIGGKLDYFKFQNVQNPFGIVFQPTAIEVLVSRALDEQVFTEKDIFYHNEQWHCFEVHSLVSRPDKDEYLSVLNTQLNLLRDYLLSATHIVFTYGTAWAYRHRKTNTLVANCHKVPQEHFAKELLSVEAISDGIRKTVSRIQAVNADVIIIGTISPVRHLKDGFVENMRGKAHLISAIHLAMETHATMRYFPSYELVMDELRDYRFYAEDLLHPNNTAIAMIWERFKTVWIASETEAVQKEIDAIQKGLAHRPFYLESTAYREFQHTLQQKIVALQKEIPHLKF
jgi:hypothetical protein